MSEVHLWQDFEKHIEETSVHIEKVRMALEYLCEDDPEDMEELSSIQDGLDELLLRFNRIKRKKKVSASSLVKYDRYTKPTGSYVYEVVKPMGESFRGMENTKENRDKILVQKVAPRGCISSLDPDKDVVIESPARWE